jgi:hypothetical protein
MSWSWYIYTTLAPPDVVRVDAAYQAAIDAYQEEHDVIDNLTEVGPGGPPPPRPEAVSAYRAQLGELCAQASARPCAARQQVRVG